MATKSEKSRDEREKQREQVIKNIRALLISAPCGLTVAEIQNDHQNMIGKPLPYRELGYRTALDLIKDLPDVCEPKNENGILVLKCIPDEKTRHIARLVARQKSKKPKSRRTTVAIPVHVPKPTVPYYVRSCVKQLLAVYPSGVLGSMFCSAYCRRFGHELNYARYGFKSLGDFLRALSDIIKIEHVQGGGFRVIALATTSSSKPQDNAKKAQQKPPSRLSGDSAVMSEIPGITAKVEESTAIQKVNSTFEAQIGDKSGFNDQIKEEIKEILKKRKNGVWAARLPVEYRNMYQKDLHVKLLGFSSIVELVGAMPDVVNIQRPTKTGDWYLTLKAREENSCKATTKPRSDSPQQFARQSINPLVPFSGPGRPQQDRKIDTTSSCSQDQLANLPEAVLKGVYYSKLRIQASGDTELFVSHVIDPGFFWIVLIEHWPKLEALAEDLSVFYSSKDGEKYKVPEWFLSVGQVCCALYDDGAWYRALIVGIHSIHSIEVFFVDYGNTSKVSFSNLRILRSPFVKLPAQAIQCRLANIKPHGDKWTPGAIHRLYHMTKDYKPLVGIVCGTKGEAINIFLCDTNSEKDVYINDALLEEGFAEIAPDTSQIPLSLNPRTLQTADNGRVIHGAAPGLPTPRREQQQINQQLAALMTQGVISQSTLNPFIPDFSLPVGAHGTPYFNYLQNISSASAPPTIIAQEAQTREETKDAVKEVNEMSADDLQFMEEVCQELEHNAADECLLKRIQLTEAHFIHVVNIERRPYVISAEISAFFWDDDLLRSMLRQKKLPVEKVVLSTETNENLFQEIVSCGVQGSTEGGKPRSHITLYELHGIPEILQAFHHPSKELIDRVKDEVDRFDIEGESYWRLKSSDSDSAENDSESQEEGVEDFRIEELRLLFQAMQFRRKRILQSMLVDGPGTGSSVDELKEVETKLQRVKLEIEEKERQEHRQAAQKISCTPAPSPCISPVKPLYPVFFSNPHVGMVYSGTMGRSFSE